MKAPRSIRTFDYEIPENLHIEPGDLVQVEFRRSKLTGLVRKISGTTEIRNVKPVLKKIDDLSLSPGQMELLDWLEGHYFISPALALKTVLPDIPKARRQIAEKKESHRPVTVARRRLPQIKKAIDKMSDRAQLLHYSDVNEKNAVIVGLLKKLRGRALVIIPELKDMISVPGFDIGRIHSGLPKNTIYKEWSDFKSGRRKIIIGTKKAIFFPVDGAELLIVDDEENKSHKNFDQNPRYWAVAVAEQISKINPRLKILYTSRAPLMRHYFELPRIELLQENAQVTVVNMEDEKRSGNYSFFSDALKNGLAGAGKAFLLFNRKGEFKLYVCRKCGHMVKLDDNVAACPKCRSLDLKKAVFGTKRLLSEIRKMLPAKNIIEITKDEMPEGVNDADVIIGTDFALNRIDKEKIDLIGIISVDHELAIPAFDSSERIFQKLVRIIDLGKKTVIQTRSPLHPAIKMAARLNFPAFYEQEKALRQKLDYPPYGTLIKVVNKRTKQEKYVRDCEELEKIKDPDDYIIDRL